MNALARFAAVRRLLGAVLVAAALLPGCRQYATSNGPTLRDQVPQDTSGASARLRVKSPGQRTGMSSTAQDIERSVGY